MKKISNKYKVLMALCSGPKTQAELVRETKVKNVYQMMSGLIKSGEVIKQDKKILLRDSLNPQYTKEHKIAHYKYLAGVTKFKPRPPEDNTPKFPRMSDARKLRIAIDETEEVSAEQIKAVLPKPESEIIKTLRGEVENIQDGIRSLMMARSYLLRRIEEERNNREPSHD
jgi:hypothetical protein